MTGHPGEFPAATKAELVQLRSLREGAGRRATGECLVEGERALGEALAAGAVVRHVAVESRLVDAPVVARALAAGGRVTLADSQRLQRVSDRGHAPGLVAAVEIPPAWSVAAMPGDGPALVIGLCGLQDPGNVGTIVRSALAFGAAGLLLAPGTADPFGPKVVRATAGAVFELGIGRVDNDDAWEATARAASLDVTAAAAPNQAEGDGAASLPSRCLLLLGHETRGVPVAGVRAVTIAHEPAAESLNVAMAGAILMSRWYDAARARR